MHYGAIAVARRAGDVPFVNDVTLYLQAGYAADLLAQIGGADFTTLLVNGYWGQRLGESARRAASGHRHSGCVNGSCTMARC